MRNRRMLGHLVVMVALASMTTQASAQQLLQVMQNFDITNLTGTNVNDFEIWLNGVSGTQILTNSNQPYTNAPNLGLTGWTPASITTGTYVGNPQTIVRWGGTNADPVTPGTVVHFGVTLTSGVQPWLTCMTWSFNGKAVYTPGGCVTITSNPPINGQVVVKTVNEPYDVGKICDLVVGTGTPQWVQRHVGIFDRYIELTELTLGTEIVNATELIDSQPIFLDEKEALELLVTLKKHAGPQALVYWYTTFLDDGGTPGTPFSTMFYGYNYTGGGGEFVPPASYSVFRGFELSGALSDFADSDDVRARYNPGFTLNSSEAPVWLVFDASAPSAVDFVVESNAGTPGLTYTIEAFNWNDNFYDVVGTQAESFNTDQSMTYVIMPTNHINGSGDVRGRVGWRKTGLTINFPWEVRVDQVGWNQ